MSTQKTTHTIESLERFMGNILDDVQKRSESLQNKHKVSYRAVRDYLEANTPDLLERMVQIEKSVNSDIFRKLSQGTATHEECEEWRNRLLEWQALIIEGVNTYEEFYTLSHVA